MILLLYLNQFYKTELGAGSSPNRNSCFIVSSRLSILLLCSHRNNRTCLRDELYANARPCNTGFSSQSHCSHFQTTALMRPRRLKQYCLQLVIYIYTAISKNVVAENEECQLSNGDCTTEKNCGYWILIANKLPWCRLHTVPAFDGESYRLSC